MSYDRAMVPLQGSALPLLAGQRVLGKSAAGLVHSVTLHLKHPRALPSERRLHELTRKGKRPLSHEDFEARYGLTDREVEQTHAFARSHGLRIVYLHKASCTAELEATSADFERAFGVEFEDVEHHFGTHRGYAGEVRLPEGMADLVEGVTGLDSRGSLFGPLSKEKRHDLVDVPSDAPLYYPQEVGELYDFPKGLDGTGQTIAIFEFGGGFNRKDLKRYFKQQDLPMPKVKSVLVGKGKNEPFQPDNAFVETNLDVQITGSLAPGAKHVIYLADKDAGLVEILNASVFDLDHKPNIISISFAGAEELMPYSTWRTMDKALARAAALGITILASAGDGGSPTMYYRDCGARGAHVNYPASSTYVLACGGTSLFARNGRVEREHVWNDLGQSRSATGGGVSRVFEVPRYQRGVQIPRNPTRAKDLIRGRGVPDVAGNADPFTGFKVMVAGKLQRIGGTSAVAPLWAALIARFNQALGKDLGFVNDLLYSLEGKGFVQMTKGNNGAYEAGPGWNACAGLGRPHRKKLLKAIKKALEKT